MRDFASPSVTFKWDALSENAIYFRSWESPCFCYVIRWSLWPNKEAFWRIPWSKWALILPVFFNEASDNEINRVVVWQKMARDLVIGLGGGKTIDSAKAVADLYKITSCDCSTIASPDAPVSALSVSYTDEGAFGHYIFYSKSRVVLVDSKWSLKHQNACSLLYRRWPGNSGRSACSDASQWKNHVGSTTNLSGCRHCTTLWRKPYLLMVSKPWLPNEAKL